MNALPPEWLRDAKKYTTASVYHGHPIPVWAVEEKCVQCGFPASHKVMEDNSHYAFVGHPLTAYLCCDHFFGWCSNDDAPKCGKCGHFWYNHEQHVDRWFDGEPGEYCLANMGMGDPCGCEEKRPQHELD